MTTSMELKLGKEGEAFFEEPSSYQCCESNIRSNRLLSARLSRVLPHALFYELSVSFIN